MKYYCNPMNLNYTYQVFDFGPCHANREAADPTMVLFKNKYYLFPSMTNGFFVSEDLDHWEKKAFLGDNIPVYDYAPDVRVAGEYLYFSASKRNENCDFFRTKDPETEPFEQIPGTFPFWDPNLFVDDDGRFYFYWGCSNMTPIWGVELDPETMHQIGEPKELIFGHDDEHGFERRGEDHYFHLTEEDIEEGMQNMVIHMFEGMSDYHELPQDKQDFLRAFISNTGPFVEGAWMTKHDGKYYLQYAVPATENNVYGDGCYVGDSPLGPFTPAKNNPYSYHPGGFIRGAGHGSTMEDRNGQYWHISSMGINVNHDMERRLGLWKAGFDDEGELWCDQRFGDWPRRFDQPSWTDPDWMLLSYGKDATVSSGKGKEYLTDETIRTWWVADADDKQPVVTLDLGAVKTVNAVQINFADDHPEVPVPEDPAHLENRHIQTMEESKDYRTRWTLEASEDGSSWTMLCDKSQVETDLSHDFLEFPDGVSAQYLRLTVIEVPIGVPALSGIRVFGKAEGEAPAAPTGVTIEKVSDLDVVVSWDADEATGHIVNWGFAPDKLYHSCTVFGKNEQKIGALIKGQPVYFRVDSFNESGVSHGSPKSV